MSLEHKEIPIETAAPENLMVLEEVFATKTPQLYRVAARVLENHQDSEDALQDGLLSAFVHLDQFQGRSHLASWVHTIVENSARMHLRARSRLPTTSIADNDSNENGEWPESVLVDPQPNPEQVCVREEQRRMLKERLGYLPLTYRSVVQMCIFDGLLQKEAAEKLEVPVGTVKARLHRACALLVKQMQGSDSPQSAEVT